MSGVYSSENRITIRQIWAKAKGKLCRGAFGTQTDCQCLGYDAMCGLAWLFYDTGEKWASNMAVYRAQQECRDSTYSRGFQKGWDGDTRTEDDREFLLGYKDGKEAASWINWVITRPDNGAWR